MRPNDLPERWIKELERYTDVKYGSDYKHRGKLGAGDFASGSMVHIELADGSQAFFKNTFFIEVPELNEVTVFTEHCGYHIFPLPETKVRQYEESWEASDIES